VLDGVVKGYRREVILERFDIPDSASVDRQGLAFRLDYSGNSWTSAFEYQEFDYSRDLSNALNSRLFLLSFNDAVISQVLLLTNWNAGVQAQKQFASFSVRGGLEYFEEVVGQRQNSLYSLGLVLPLGDTVAVAADYFTYAEQANDIVALELQLSW
jgi:hypothetical protein